MKVYIVTRTEGEECDCECFMGHESVYIDKVFLDEEKAKQYVKDNKDSWCWFSYDSHEVE